MKSIAKSDIFIIIGLLSFGVGLFLWLGTPRALTVIGVVFFLLGFFAESKPFKNKKDI